MRRISATAEGFVERDGVKVGYEVFGSGEPAARVRPDRPAGPLPGLEGPGAVPGPDVAGRHHRPARQRPVGPAGVDPPPTPTPSSWPTPSRSWTPPASTGPSSSGCAAAPGRAADGGAASGPGARRGQRRHLGAVPHAARCRARRSTTSTETADTDEGWAKDNRHYWLRDWRGLRRVLLRRAAPRAALHQAARGLRRLGDGDQRRDEPAVRRRAAVVVQPRGHRGASSPG